MAVAEEFPTDASGNAPAGGLMHDRRVTRVITPGTLIDEQFMDPYRNNYILAVHVEIPAIAESDTKPQGCNSPTTEVEAAGSMASVPIGLAWLDLSTGHFFTQSSSLSLLPSIIARISPSEIVLDKDLQAMQHHGIFSVLQDDRHIVTYSPATSVSPVIEWAPMLESQVSSSTVELFTNEEVAAGSSLLKYVETRLTDSSMKLQPPLRYQAMDIMSIDRNSMRALEIKETIRDGAFKGSLLHAMRRTVTKSGARLLSNWLGKYFDSVKFKNDELIKAASPTTSLDTINSRLDLVSRMVGHISLRENVVSQLRRCHDSQRLVQKFSLGRGDPEDLLALATTITATQQLVVALQKYAEEGDGVSQLDKTCLVALILRIELEGPAELAKSIIDAVDQDGLVLQRRMEDDEAGEMVAFARDIASSEGSVEDLVNVRKAGNKKKPTSLKDYYSDAWIMTPSASKSLRNLHKSLNTLVEEKAALEKDLQDRLGSTTLTLRWSPGLRHFCHIKGKEPLNMTELRSVSSSKSTRSFHHPEWTELGGRIDQVKVRIHAEEQHVFRKLRQQVIVNLVKLRRNATVLDELDVVCSFAILSEELGLVRPILNRSISHKVIGGRHPTVQGGLREQGRSFVTNDCFVGDKERLWLITGPNMAGKSTFLRQNALITIMAQVGCYVPAEYAEIGVVDQIFSRVGSADNLYRDQSTFMVEMLETAAILKHATPRSFVIMDEIGRGTTPEDGISIAFAALHHLYHVNKCRALFATHFHMLADLSNDMDRVGFYCTDVAEDGQGSFHYLHRLRKGVNRESHALKVAKLAGLPEAAIEVARNMIISNRQTYIA